MEKNQNAPLDSETPQPYYSGNVNDCSDERLLEVYANTRLAASPLHQLLNRNQITYEDVERVYSLVSESVRDANS